MVFCGGLRNVSDIMVDKYHEDDRDEDPLEFQGKSKEVGKLHLCLDPSLRQLFPFAEEERSKAKQRKAKQRKAK